VKPTLKLPCNVLRYQACSVLCMHASSHATPLLRGGSRSCSSMRSRTVGVIIRGQHALRPHGSVGSFADSCQLHVEALVDPRPREAKIPKMPSAKCNMLQKVAFAFPGNASSAQRAKCPLTASMSCCLAAGVMRRGEDLVTRRYSKRRSPAAVKASLCELSGTRRFAASTANRSKVPVCVAFASSRLAPRLSRKRPMSTSCTS